MDITGFGLHKLGVLLLLLARTAGIFTLTPVFGINQIPMKVRVFLSVGIAFIFLPMVGPAPSLPTEIIPMLLMVARETAIGLIIGFVCIAIFAAIEMAGQFIDSQTGFRFGSMVDPAGGAQVSVIERFQKIFAGLLFFAIDGHHVLIVGLADSFKIAPIGQLALNPVVGIGAMDMFAALFTISIRIAAPILVAVFLADIALAVTSKVVPQMNVFIVGLPLKMGVGIVGMLVALPVMATMSNNLFGNLYNETMKLVSIVGR